MNFFLEYYKLDEDNVHAKDINFQEMYDEFNKKYFGGKLPKIPIEVTAQLRRAGGKAHAKSEADAEGVVRYVPTRIQISSFYKSHPDRFKNILLHEMLHVFFFSTMTSREYERYFRKNAHSDLFALYAKKLSDASGITVGLTDDISDAEVHQTKKKTFGYLVCLINTNTAIRVVKDSFYDDEQNLAILKRHLVKMKSRGLKEAYIGKSDNPYLLRFPVQRSVSDLTMYGIPQEIYDELKQNSTDGLEK